MTRLYDLLDGPPGAWDIAFLVAVAVLIVVLDERKRWRSST